MGTHVNPQLIECNQSAGSLCHAACSSFALNECASASTGFVSSPSVAIVVNSCSNPIRPLQAWYLGFSSNLHLLECNQSAGSLCHAVCSSFGRLQCDSASTGFVSSPISGHSRKLLLECDSDSTGPTQLTLRVLGMAAKA